MVTIHYRHGGYFLWHSTTNRYAHCKHYLHKHHSQADKHGNAQDKTDSTCKLLPEHIRHKIEHRNNIRAQDACEPFTSELDSEITLPHTNKPIWHMEGTPRHTLGLQAQNTYSLKDNT